MTKAPRISAKRHRSQLSSLLYQRLKYRWLGNPDSVSDAIADVFGCHHQAREGLVSSLVKSYRAGKITHPFVMARLISRHQDVRALAKSTHWQLLDQPTRNGLLREARQSQKADWQVPAIKNVKQLCQWLSLPSTSLLDWLTLPHTRRKTDVFHYRQTPIKKRDGSVRWIEEPRPVLKRVQRNIAQCILSHIPLHDAVHGFRSGRGIATCAREHVGCEVVLRIDLENFFGSIGTPRIAKLFQVAGYSRIVALSLGRLCTLPASRDQNCDPVLTRSRLPQGAPTSPSLANAIAYRLDRRLAGLASSLGVTYTRYADDLVFSGNESLSNRTRRFESSVAAIAMEEGFRINFAKTRAMYRGGRQHVLGLTVNDQVNTSRGEYDRLRAILNNCIHHGPNSQNRDKIEDFKAHLQGRIAHITSIHHKRGHRLMKSFAQIDWQDL